MSTVTSLADKWGIHPKQTWLRGGRPEPRVQFDEELGLWHVYGYPEAMQVLGSTATFSSEVAKRFIPGADQWDFDGDLTHLDPPEHQRLRNLVTRAFTPKVVAGLEPRITELTHELLDAVDPDGFDLVTDLAYPLPVIVIADLLGVPNSDRELFKKWAEDVLGQRSQVSTTDDSGEQERTIAAQEKAQQEMKDYLKQHSAERRRHPREDLLTDLIQAEVEGRRLTDNQIGNFAGLLIMAGHVTTTMLLGNTILCLDTYPDAAERVRADRSLIRTTIEESLRLLSPIAAAYRATNVDVDIAGTHVPKDQMLEVWVSAANRDERQFTDPHTFDPARDPNPHLGFGRGIHFCLGAPLARLEGRVALNILLDRFPALRTDPDNLPTFLDTPDLTGVWTLPLRTHD
ncbi:cytochrome P450 [Kitasatospora sp. NPDC088264]|uniref:cytochrome P450 n=1 Tax=Kitasatospora sp. NPDC088264 TaxID=3155296 RepID=UPI00344A1325